MNRAYWIGLITVLSCSGCTGANGWPFAKSKPQPQPSTAQPAANTGQVAAAPQDKPAAADSDPSVTQRVGDYVKQFDTPDGAASRKPTQSGGSTGESPAASPRRPSERRFPDFASRRKADNAGNPQGNTRFASAAVESGARAPNARASPPPLLTVPGDVPENGRPSNGMVETPIPHGPPRVSLAGAQADATDPPPVIRRPDASTRPKLLRVTAGPATAKPQQASAGGIAVNRAANVGPNGGMRQRIEELEAAVQKNPNDVSSQIGLRILYLAEGLDARALQATPGMTRDNEDIVLGVTRMVQAARASPGRDSAQWADRQLAAVDGYRAMLKERADLQVPHVVLCRQVTGFGVYDEITPAEFPAGEATPVLLYTDVANFRSEQSAGSYRVKLSARIAILDRSGQEVWMRSDENIEDVSRNQRHDFFLPIEIRIPATLNPGQYTVKVAVTDEIAHKSNENSTQFRLVAK